MRLPFPARPLARPLAASLLLGTALAGASPAMAQSWDGSASTDWLDAANWTPAGLPVFNSATTIDTTTNAPVVGAGQTATGGTVNVGVTATGQLTVQGGGLLELGNAANNGALNIGGSQTSNATGGNGRVTVTGAGSEISSPSGFALRIGVRPQSVGLLEILAGGVVRSSTGQIGTVADSTGTLTVSGAGSQWIITSSAAGVSIGNLNSASARGTLNVLNGGSVTYPGGVGWNVGQGGTINVAGSGSTITVPTAVELRGTLSVSDGGQANFNRIFTGTGGTALIEVSGAGSLLSVPDLSISPFADQVTTIRVADGGRIDTTALSVAFSAGNADADITLTGAGSLWRIASTATNNPVLGAGANSPTLEILAGARMESLTTFSFNLGQAANLRIAGSGSTLETAGAVSLSASNSTTPTGTLLIEDGGRLITHADTDSGLGFSVGRDMTIRSGGSWISDGGPNAGIQIESSNLLIDGGSMAVTGIVSIGQRFSGTVLTLRGANFSARALNVGSVSGNMVILGGNPGAAAAAVGQFDVASLSLGNGNQLIINHTSDSLVIGSAISGGAGSSGPPVIRHIAGNTLFSGASGGYGGRLEVIGGQVVISGALGSNAASASIDAESEGFALLGGTGSFGGDVSISDGTLAPGNSAGTFTIGGDLVLNGFSTLAFELGAPDQGPGNGSDHIVVGGDLTLDGTLDISNIGGFGGGLYRLINYAGSLTDNGLEFGAVPEGFAATGLTLSTATSGQVNLIVAAEEPDFIFWDGSDTTADSRIDGGNGSWTTTGLNWTTEDGGDNGAYDPADFLIFTGPQDFEPEAADSSGIFAPLAATASSSAGTVTIDNGPGQVSIANGIQFAVTGYTVTGGALELAAGDITVRVGDGTSAGADFVATIAAPITGSGRLVKTDLGTLILQGASSYSGGTQVDGGTLQGNSTSLTGNITTGINGTLLFDQQNAGTYAGILGGSGDVLKQGSGTLTLSGNSAGVRGRLIVEAGTLNLTGSVGSLLRVASGATLTGTGTAGELEVAGTIAPGGTTGTITVTGDAVFRAGSTYRVDLAANGGTDLVTASEVRIEGGTVAISLLDPETSYTDGSRFVIARGTSGLTGTFAGLTESSAFLDFALGYDATTAFLTLDLIRQFPDVALTFNQRQASYGLAELDRTAGSDSLAMYNTILFLDAPAARAAFDFASGEIYADIVAAGLKTGLERGSAALRRAAEPGREGWEAWMAGSLAHARSSGDGNGSRFTRQDQALELGLDRHGADDRWALGISGGWRRAEIGNADRVSDAELDGWFISGMARYGQYGRGLTLATSASRTSMAGDAARTIRIGTLTRNSAAEVETSETTLAAEARYGVAGSGGWAFGPSVALEYARASIDGFAETGAGSLNVSSSGFGDSWLRYGAGGFAAWRGDRSLVVLDVRYAGMKADNSAASLRLAGSPRAYTILPARAGEQGLALGGSASVELGGNLSLGGEAGAFFGDARSSFSGSAWLRWRF